jgi:hypothetical protein
MVEYGSIKFTHHVHPGTLLVLTVRAARNSFEPPARPHPSIGQTRTNSTGMDMKKLATLVIAFGFLIISAGVSAADLRYPYAPLPPYAADELQKLVDGLSGPTSSTSPTLAPDAEKSVDQHKASQEESHAAAAVPKRRTHPAAGTRRHACQKLV